MKNPVVEQSVDNSALSVTAAKLKYGPLSISAVLDAVLGGEDIRYIRVDGRKWYRADDVAKAILSVTNGVTCKPERLPSDCKSYRLVGGEGKAVLTVSIVGLLIMLLHSTSAKVHPLREWTARALEANSQENDSIAMREYLSGASAALQKVVDALDALAEKVKKG